MWSSTRGAQGGPTQAGALLAGVAGWQLDAALRVADTRVPRDAVEREPADLHRVLPVARQTASRRLQSYHQFLDEERLGQVVVGTEFQPLDAVAQFVARGQQDHRCGDAGRTQALEHRQAVAARQHDVEHDRVEPALVCALEAGVAVEAMHHLHAAGHQAGADELGEFRFVFDQQDFHAVAVAVAGGAAGSAGVGPASPTAAR